MGIPAFYRWLVERHPLTVADVVEESPAVVNGVTLPVDSSRHNPNGIEFDNLYLDMNGIIHPCFHPEGLPSPMGYEEVFKAVFKYIDKIFSMIRPRKLLYMAIDGVAPRAKMNHQRARRFKAAKEAADEASQEEKGKSDRGEKVEELTRLKQYNKLDSNVITPGTEFMSLLSSALHYYVHLKMNEDPGWKDVKVIVSDASAPGEGEHKIMSYIRLQRNLPGFDPNTRHCLYGLDADLIMLALASHEIHFSILRENVSRPPKNYKSPKYASNSRGFEAKGALDIQQSHVKNVEDYISKQNFQFLHIWLLRDYLAYELRIPDRTVKTDLERLIDDFVFMCMFVGNDFLPHMPSLEISEGAIDLLIKVYKVEFLKMGGYLTDSWKVNLERLQHFLQAVGSYEDVIFKKRSQVEKELNAKFRGSFGRFGPKKINGSTSNAITEVEPVIDQIKLEEAGWKERYYAQKFEARTDNERERIRKNTVVKYMEGLCWVMHYYYEGVCSWQWFYPYYYAPFASDFKGLGKLQIEFTLGMPFKPFDLLMGVLPAASAHALPISYRKLMTDPSSPILDFYPNDFECDMNGKRFSWQAISKLPFIEESRLLLELAKIEHTLTDEEKQRNSLGLDKLFVHKSHALARQICSFCIKSKDHPKLQEAKVKQKINPQVSGGLNGFMYVSDDLVSPSEIDPPIDNMPMIKENKVISIFYKYPPFHPHIPRPPGGVIMPSKSVSKKDVLPPPVLWHEKFYNYRWADRDSIFRHPTKSVLGPGFTILFQHKHFETQRGAELARLLVKNSVKAKKSHTIADRIGLDDVAPVPSEKETPCVTALSDVASVPNHSSTKVINGEENVPNASSSKKRKRKRRTEKSHCNSTIVADVVSVGNPVLNAPALQALGESDVCNQNSTVPSKEVNDEGQQSCEVALNKRRRRRRAKKALANSRVVADVSSVGNPVLIASTLQALGESDVCNLPPVEVNDEGQQSRANSTVVADVALVHIAPGLQSLEGPDICNLSPVPTQNPSAPSEEMSGEGKQSSTVASKKRKRSRARKAGANSTSVADVASLLNAYNFL